MSPEKRIEKSDLPLADDAEIVNLVRQFEQCTLPYKHWTHRAHLAVATLYLRKFSFDDALVRIRKNICAYNQKCGDPEGYNESITLMFMKKIDAESKRDDNSRSIHEQVKRLQHLCTVDWLYNYYSPDLIWSDQAKAGWVDPDVVELDF